jgi:hypothetical protein
MRVQFESYKFDDFLLLEEIIYISLTDNGINIETS